ncbi:MAG: VCBS repeat-containing protein [Planctomycetes bacterium]|nr:VCBS repeat-containing protein [Planctomycetota bacterium]
MDFDRDGKLDFVSGSYDPGEVFLFRGVGKGKFVHATMLVDELGVPLVHHPVEWQQHAKLLAAKSADHELVQQTMVASYGSFPMPIDFDADGDLDLLIGSLGGNVFWRAGVVLDKKAKKGAVGPFAAESVPLQAAGVTLQVHSHADPFAADWDGDGVFDLVVGAGDGSVGWYRNEGSPQAPRFAARQELVTAKSATDTMVRAFDAKGEPLPGTRAQICVVDHDGDGRADLVVGDHARAGGDTRKVTSYVWLYLRSGPTTPR